MYENAFRIKKLTEKLSQMAAADAALKAEVRRLMEALARSKRENESEVASWKLKCSTVEVTA